MSTEYTDKLGLTKWISEFRNIHSQIVPHITKDMLQIEFEFFWSGIYSQWDPSDFTVMIPKNDHSEKYPFTFNRAEQFMMWAKAFMFDDFNTADKILASNNPSEQKALGRTASGFIEDVWNANAQDIVLIGSIAKFSQDQKKLQILINTNNKLLVESSPKDRIWGIGLHKTDAKVNDPANWQGTNWLGICLTQAKEILRLFDDNRSNIDSILKEIKGDS